MSRERTCTVLQSHMAFVEIAADDIDACACSQDHKAVGEGDTGPNTGGMGAYSPAPAMTPRIQRQAST